MPDDAPLGPEPLPPDLQTIRQLVRLMARYDLTAIDLGQGAHKIRLRRRNHADATAPGVFIQQAPSQAAAAPPQPATAPPATAPATPKGVSIDSPMVGTFYSASNPDAAPFVSAGTVVRADTTVCVIEAMKVFTDIPSGLAGTITEVLVKNGQPVEFGQPLFRIEPA